MMTFKEYEKWNNEFMTEYETLSREYVKEYVKKNTKKPIIDIDKIPFCKDGVVNPEVWYAQDNKFRPLFILKEVSFGVNTKKEFDKKLDNFFAPNCNDYSIDFVGNDFEDVRNGCFYTWKKLVKLAIMLEQNIEKSENYDISKLNHQKGKLYTGTIEGYKNVYENINKEYNTAVNKIAVINMKKLIGGTSVGSELSDSGLLFTEHMNIIQPNENTGMIYKQIEAINPTVIIFCGKKSGKYISSYFTDYTQPQNGEICWYDEKHKRIMINEFHPRARVSNENFFDKVISQYLSVKENHHF